MFHADSSEVTKIIVRLENLYGKMTESRRRKYQYLRMYLDFSADEKFVINMKDCIK